MVYRLVCPLHFRGSDESDGSRNRCVKDAARWFMAQYMGMWRLHTSRSLPLHPLNLYPGLLAQSSRISYCTNSIAQRRPCQVGAAPSGLPMGGAVPRGGGVFYVSRRRGGKLTGTVRQPRVRNNIPLPPCGGCPPSKGDFGPHRSPPRGCLKAGLESLPGR